ncbi:hypothetical protein PY650_28865 [Rhizobium calliandrae]|uniref:Uncharacterized protein n=1 Tax=Rhizobium calliandrae TaxID=1312182 RepID=A0ABT7KLQ2_9HYPH|nr:hypothetical protein [Rhizobium calliandrae]MDL2409569.1 hypothetical protein [Rhizobium calliandrae]
MKFLPSLIDKPISPSIRRSQLSSRWTSFRQIVIVHSNAITAALGKALVVDRSA